MPITTEIQFTFEVEIEGQTYKFPILAQDEKGAKIILKRRLDAVIKHFGL